MRFRRATRANRRGCVGVRLRGDVEVELLEPRRLLDGAAFDLGELAGRREVSGTLSEVGSTDVVNFKMTAPGWLDAGCSIQFSNGPEALQLKNGKGETIFADGGTSGVDITTAGVLKLEPGDYQLRVRRTEAVPDWLHGGEHDYTLTVIPDYAGDSEYDARDAGPLAGVHAFRDYVGTLAGVRSDYFDVYQFSVPSPTSFTATLGGTHESLQFFADTDRDGHLDANLGGLPAVGTTTRESPAGNLFVFVGGSSDNAGAAQGYSLTIVGGPAPVPQVSARVSAFRPQTDGLDYTLHPVPAPELVRRGAGIRINGDDDNRNGQPDASEAGTVSGEDDLIRMDVVVGGEPLPAGWTYGLRRTNAALKVWTTPSKGVPVLDGGRAAVDLAPGTSHWWVEWSGSSHGSGHLVVELRDPSGVAVKELARARFVTLRGIIFGFPGAGNTPVDPMTPDDEATQGMMVIGHRLYDQGYDVHLFDEAQAEVPGLLGSTVASSLSAFNAYNELVAAGKRSQSDVGLMGYSRGGGRVYSLSAAMASRGLGHPRVTAYIDAVRTYYVPFLSGPAEARRPAGSEFHINYWQRWPSPIRSHGAPTDASGGPTENHDVVAEGFPDVDHHSIDDLPYVRTGVMEAFLGRLRR